MIEAIVKTKGTVTARQIVDTFEESLGVTVVSQIRKMEADRILTYPPPLEREVSRKVTCSRR